MASTILLGSGDVQKIKSTIIDKVTNQGISNELIYEIERGSLESPVYLLVFEKYYFRNGSRTSLTVLISKNEETIIVDVTANAGIGLLNRYSLGAETHFVNIATDGLMPLGFKVVSSL